MMGTRLRSIERASLAICAWFFVVAGALAAAPPAAESTPPSATTTWSPAQKLAGDLPAWFPDIALDRSGAVHIVWNTSEAGDATTAALGDIRTREAQLRDFLMYQQFGPSAGTSLATDIGISHNGEAMRNSILADRDGTIDVLYRAGEHIWFIKAPTDAAVSARAWSERRRISGLGSAYYSAIAQDVDGVLHVAYTESRPVDTGRSDVTTLRESVYYRRSSDGGATWSEPVRLSPTTTLHGATRPQVQVSGATVAVIWDEGYDNINGVSDPAQGEVRVSPDGGTTWKPAQIIVDPDGPIEQVTLAFGSQSRALLVWRQTKKDVIRYRTSSNNGAMWTAPATVPGFIARPYLDKHQFDRYALTADSAGRFHLFAVGQVGKQDDLALFQLEMMDATWSAPQVLYHGEGQPEYPRIATDGGNRIVLAFFVRDTIWTVGNYRVWRAEGIAASPAASPQPMPTFIPTAVPVRQTAAPRFDAPVSTVPPGTITLEQRPSVGNPPGIVPLGGSIFAVIGLVLSSMAVRLWWLRHV